MTLGRKLVKVPGMAEKLGKIKQLKEPKYYLAEGEEPPKLE